jgi:hypothetical protein
MKLTFLILAAGGLALTLYYRDYASALLITATGFMVAQA